MANRQSRGIGQLQQVQSRAAIGGVPDFAVDSGAAARVLEQLGGSLSARLGKMADDAAAREGEAAGANAGAAASAKFVEKAMGASGAAPGAGTRTDAQTAAGDAPIAADAASAPPLQLRHDGTIRGGAYDAAAFKAYGWRYKTGLLTALGQAAADNPDSPGGYEAAVAKATAPYLEDANADPAVKELFQQTLASTVPSDRLAIAARHQARVEAEARAAAVDGAEATRATLERSAYALGANPAADQLLAEPLTRAMAAIDHEVRDGTFTPKQGAAARKRLQSTVLEARTQGTFDALPTPEAKQDFAIGVMDSWKKGEGGFAGMTLEEAKALSDRLYSKATTEASRQTAAQKGEKAALEDLLKADVESIAGSGAGLSPSQTGLWPSRVHELVGEAGYQKWQEDRATAQATFQSTAGMEAETPAELGARLEALRPKPGVPLFPGQQKIYDAAVKQRDAVLEARKTDPLGQANTAGIIALKAIDTTSPDSLVASLQLRAQQAQAVSGAYGTPITIFRPEERQSLTTALLDNPTLLPQFARQIETAMGPDLAPRALGELSDAGPALAHAAGISMATGDSSVADDVARVLAGRRDKSISVKMPTDNVLGDAAGRELGPVFLQNDKARAAVADTANVLFEKDAATLGFDPGEVNKQGSAAAAAYSRAIDRALGSRTIDGVQYGGRAEVNGVPIVAPSFLPADRPETLIHDLRDEDLAFLPDMLSANGVPIRAAELRQAHLVTIGDGLYRVALGDPQSVDPQYVAAKSGGYWVLDLRQLDALHRLPPLDPASFSPQGANPVELVRRLLDTSGMDRP